MARGQLRTVVVALSIFASAAFAQQPPGVEQVFAFVDARENVLSKQVPPTRTGTNRRDFGIPEPMYDFGNDVPVSTGLGGMFRFWFWTSANLQARDVPTEPSRDPRAAMLAVAPKVAGQRPGLVFVITEWWQEGYNEVTCRKALTAYVVGAGGAVLAQSSAADHACIDDWKERDRHRNQLFSSLISTPSMSAALRGQVAAPPVNAPPPPPGYSAPPPPPSAPAPVPAASTCSDAQVAKLKSYGISDDDLRRMCAGTK